MSVNEARVHNESAPKASISARRRLNHKRSKKACRQCHVRKVRCNVVEHNPCSNCVDAGSTCEVGPRKNTRQSSRDSSPSAEHKQKILYHCHNFQLDDTPTATAWSVNDTTESAQRTFHFNEVAASPSVDSSTWRGFNPDPYWHANTAYPGQDIRGPGSVGASIDLSHLADLNDVFTFTGEHASFPGYAPADLDLGMTYVQQEFSPSVLPDAAFEHGTDSDGSRSMIVQVQGLTHSDEEYLRREGCLELPPAAVLKQMMRAYCMMVHPNLPVLLEDQIWSLWQGEHFRLGTYSFLVIRAMLFASINFMDIETLHPIGLTNKRDARTVFYRQAKLMFDVGVERDPVANAQACLLLTYYAPNYNRLRVNSYWLSNATRFAKIARADAHHKLRERDPNRSKLLKRLWWGVICRNHILSLGLRRACQINLDPPGWREEESILNIDDFQSELGFSLVHDLDTQHRIVDLVSNTCRLMQSLENALKLYRFEALEDRLEAASKDFKATVSDIYKSLAELRRWHDQAVRQFPFPIALDDAHETPTICVYANMMFCYYSSAVFALNQHLILLSEVFPQCRTFFTTDDAREALETANDDIGRRVQEFVQVRLVKYLPISASAFIAIPLVLQAINVTAARGTTNEGIENRRLEIFTRTLRSQQENFDGSDFCAEVLNNLVSYAKDDEKLVGSMSNWRDGKDGHANGVAALSMPGSSKVKLDWANLVHKRPCFFLRLMLYLDHALCTGGPPSDDDFPPVLRNGLP